MATSEQLTVTEALRAAVRSLVLFVRLTLDRPVRRRRVTEARVLLGAAAAAYLRERSAPGFLARALANRRAAEVRLSRLEARPGPDGERPAAVPPWRNPVLFLRKRQATAQLRAADLELGGWARGLEGTRGYLSAAQHAVAAAEAELLQADARRVAALRRSRTGLRTAGELATARIRQLPAGIAAGAARLKPGRKPAAALPAPVSPPAAPAQGPQRGAASPPAAPVTPPAAPVTPPAAPVTPPAAPVTPPAAPAQGPQRGAASPPAAPVTPPAAPVTPPAAPVTPPADAVTPPAAPAQAPRRVAASPAEAKAIPKPAVTGADAPAVKDTGAPPATTPPKGADAPTREAPAARPEPQPAPPATAPAERAAARRGGPAAVPPGPPLTPPTSRAPAPHPVPVPTPAAAPRPGRRTSGFLTGVGAAAGGMTFGDRLRARRAARAGRRRARHGAPGLADEAAQTARAAASALTSLAEPPDTHREGFMRFVRPVVGALVLTLLLGGLVALPTGALVANRVTAAESGLPDLSQLEELRRPERTEVFDRSGARIAVLRDEQDRVVLKLADIPALMQRAVVAAEDERFYEHKGVDERGIMRAAVTNLMNRDISQGGSTITQQVIRNSYPDLKDTSVDRKIKEAALAAQLETRATKRQILEDYLNLVYFGGGYYGVEAASQGYFGKSVRKLQLHEAALLAAVIRSPEGRNPRSTKRATRALVKATRDAVLDKMVQLDMVGGAVAERAKKTPIRVKPPRASRGEYPFFVDYLKQRLLGDPPSEDLSQKASDATGDKRLGRTYAERKRNLFEGGLKISTTLDPEMQREAEESVRRYVPDDGEADAGLVAIDPRTGAVRAMVGGRNYKTAQFNYAWQAKRSPGSSFKTFVLAAALADGISPDSVWESSGIPNGTEICGQDKWAPGNYEGGGSGGMTVRQATAHSVNGVFARLMARLCPERVAKMAEKLGVEIPKHDWNFPAIALGGTSVRVIDMASGYATLANGGVYHKPVAVSEVVKRSTGEVVWKEKPKGEQRISPALAYATTQVLEGVIQGGTASARGQIGRPAAGKTGTSQNYSNAWFVGYTPQLSTAVWIGNPKFDRQFSLNGTNRVTGGSFPTAVWHDFMAAALDGQEVMDFTRPEEGLQYTYLPPPTSPPTTQPGQPGQPGLPGQPQPQPQPDPGQQPGPPGVVLPQPGERFQLPGPPNRDQGNNAPG